MVREVGGLVLHDKSAFADERGADHAVDRGADRCIVQIEPCAGDVGLAAHDIGFGLAHGSNCLLVLGLGGGALARQRRNSPGLQRCLLMHRHSPRQRRLAGLQFDLGTAGDRSGIADRRL